MFPKSFERGVTVDIVTYLSIVDFLLSLRHALATTVLLKSVLHFLNFVLPVHKDSNKHFLELRWQQLTDLFFRKGELMVAIILFIELHPINRILVFETIVGSAIEQEYFVSFDIIDPISDTMRQNVSHYLFLLVLMFRLE